jgi:hypothetical protein
MEVPWLLYKKGVMTSGLSTTYEFVLGQPYCRNAFRRNTSMDFSVNADGTIYCWKVFPVSSGRHKIRWLWCVKPQTYNYIAMKGIMGDDQASTNA